MTNESADSDATPDPASEHRAATPLSRGDVITLVAGVGLAILAALAMERCFAYWDCRYTGSAQFGDWYYGASRVSIIRGAGGVVLLSFVVPWLTRRLAYLGDDSSLKAFQASADPAAANRRRAIRLLRAAALVVGVAASTLMVLNRATGVHGVLAPHIAAAAVGSLAAAISVVLWSVRGSTRGATAIIWGIPVLLLASYIWSEGGLASYLGSADPRCGHDYYGAGIIWVLLSLGPAPLVAAAVSVVLLQLALRRMRASPS